MKNIIVGCGVALFLAGCDKSPKPADFVGGPLPPEQVRLFATAPDGTKLWVVTSAGVYIYFSSSGTQTNNVETCGKNCTKVVPQYVPNKY